MRSSALLSAMALAVSTFAAAPVLAQTQDRNVCYIFSEGGGSPTLLRLNVQSHSKLNAPAAGAPGQFTYSVAGKFVAPEFGGENSVTPIFGSVLLGAGGAGSYMLLTTISDGYPNTITCTASSSSAIPANWTCESIQVGPTVVSNPSPAEIETFGPVSFSKINPSTEPLCDTFTSPE